MEVIYNGRLVDFNNIVLRPDNRAFCYGDGLFETMIVRRGTGTLLSYNFSRLKRGCKVLQMELPFTEDELEAMVWQLSTRYKESVLRMRLQVWRKTGGLYAPQQQKSDFLLSASPFLKPNWEKRKVAFSNTVHLEFSPLSPLKTMSALPYVLAGLEMKERRLDDLILTDKEGHVAECSSSNLFWKKEESWYTPKLKSGCIAGVMRAYLLDQMHEKGIKVQEVLLPKERLKEADLLIACNATGIYSIRELDVHSFEEGRQNLAELIQLPFL